MNLFTTRAKPTSRRILTSVAGSYLCPVFSPARTEKESVFDKSLINRSFWRRLIDNIILSLGNAYETALLLLEFNNTNIANIGDATGLRGSSTAGSIYIALHTADPGEAGDQTTNEATFTGYGRVAVVRSSGGWTISGNQVSNAATVTFALNTGSDQDISHYSFGPAGTGPSINMRYGPFVASGATWLPFNGTASDDKITLYTNPFSNNDRVVFAPAYDGSLPTGLTAGTVYYVVGVSGATFQVSTTQGGSAINITADGDGVCIKAKPITVRANTDRVFFDIGSLVGKID